MYWYVFWRKIKHGRDVIIEEYKSKNIQESIVHEWTVSLNNSKTHALVQNKDIINKISTFIDSQEQLKKMKLN
jgi:hypothetical protein